MTPTQQAFMADVRRFTARHFAAEKTEPTTYEVEVATLGAIVASMHGFEPTHRDKILDALQAFLLRLRAGHTGAVPLLLVRLSQLQDERRCSI